MKIIITTILLLAPVFGFAECFPKNHYYIPEAITTSGISHSQYNQILDLMLQFYGPKIKKKGFTLVFNRLWSDGTVNSDTDVEGKNWVINSYGGLARFPGVTAPAYALVACHELGHHLGGAPLYSGETWPGGGAAVEGEADYWGTLDCMKDLGYSALTAHKASQSLANVLAKLGGESKPSPATPDTSTVSTTYEDHPAAQCRLDTYLAGVVCPIRGTMSNTNPHTHSCWAGEGARPRCWFAP